MTSTNMKIQNIKVEEGIYKIFDYFNYNDIYVTSLSFVQKTELN